MRFLETQLAKYCSPQRLWLCFGALAAAAVALAVEWPALHAPINLYDEGVSLLGAKLVSEFGSVPYRDFWTMYAPAKFYLLGSAFALFGAEISVARALALVVAVAGALVVYAATALRFGGPRVGLAASALCTFACGGMGWLHLFLFGAVGICAAALRNWHSLWWNGLAGLALGALFLLRFDFGFAMTAAFAVASALNILVLQKRHAADSRGGAHAFFTAAGAAIAGFFALVAPVLGALAMAGALPQMLRWAVIFPAFGNYQQLRVLAPPPLARAVEGEFSLNILALAEYAMSIFVPAILLGLAAIATVALLRSCHGKLAWRLREEFLEICLFAAAAAAAAIYALHRADIGHLGVALSVGAVLCCVALGARHLALPPAGRALLLALLVLCLLPGSAQLIDRINTARAHPTVIEELGVRATPPMLELAQVIDYLQTQHPQEPIFVGLPRHDRIFVNNVALWFFLDPAPPTRYHELHTGVVTRSEIQAEILRELRELHVAVIWNAPKCTEANGSCQERGDQRLSAMLRNEFVEEVRIGNYAVLVRGTDNR